MNFGRKNRLNFIIKYSVRCYFNNIKDMKSLALSQTKCEMPTLGLGTWQAPPKEIETAVLKALDMGYRHIDTAFNYNNEEAIGTAVQKWINSGKGTREDLFITTKLPHVGNRAEDVRKFLQIQLESLQMSYVDLYLIHVPFAFRCNTSLTPVVTEDGNYELDKNICHIKTWEVMEQCRHQGFVRNLGLSNFNETQIERIMKSATFKPQVLQVEMHAHFQQPQLRKYCEDNNIILTAYAPLGSPGAKEHFVSKYNYKPEAFPDLLGLPIVKEIAGNYAKTPAQVLLHFLVKQRIVVIPKSTSYERLKENMGIYDFDILESEMDRLRKLDKGEDGRIFNFLFWKGVEKHPEYPFPLPVTEN